MSKQSQRQNKFYAWLHGGHGSQGLNKDSLLNDMKGKRQVVVISTRRPSSRPSTAIRTISVASQKPTVLAIRTTLASSQKPTMLAASVKVPTTARVPTSKPTSKHSSVSQDAYTPAPTKAPHVNVPEPFDVIPVQTVPAQKYLATVPTKGTQNDGNSVSNRTHALLPNLPAFNVSLPTQDVLPVEPVKNNSNQGILAGEMSPVQPIPVMTRPTVTVLQHVIGSHPTQATLQSVLVPKRKEVAPPTPQTPLKVIPPHTVPTPMPQLKQLPPIPPIEPVIIHHVPNECDCDPCSHSCGCSTNCNGR
eukprot:gene1972-17516_t